MQTGTSIWRANSEKFVEFFCVGVSRFGQCPLTALGSALYGGPTSHFFLIVVCR
jgi:hypothetical protein